MKPQILFLLIIATFIGSCNKESSTTTEEPAVDVTSYTQTDIEKNIKGLWNGKIFITSPNGDWTEDIKVDITATTMNEKAGKAEYYGPNTTELWCRYDWIYTSYDANEKQMIFDEELTFGNCIKGVVVSLQFKEEDLLVIKGKIPDEQGTFSGLVDRQ